MLESRTHQAWLLALPLTLLLAAACDPEGPGAAGTVTVAPGVDTAPFTALAIRAFPDSKEAFDPKAPLPAGALTLDQPIGSVKFPYTYSLSEGIGTTPNAEWRVVVWLSHNPNGTIDGIEAGDVFGTTRFHIGGCGAAGDYCGVTHKVDCALQTVAAQ